MLGKPQSQPLAEARDKEWLCYLGLGGLRSGVIANEQESYVVSLVRAPGKLLDGIDYSLLELLERRVLETGQGFAETRNTVHLLLRIRGFGDAIAEEHQCVTGLELLANGDVSGGRNQTHRVGSLRENFANHAATKK